MKNYWMVLFGFGPGNNFHLGIHILTRLQKIIGANPPES